MIQATDGFFYGTTAAGGVSDNGTIFRMDAAGNVSVLHRFTGLDGAGPSAELLEAGDGYMYGTTAGGGLHFSGTAFRIDALGNFQTLHDFDFGVDDGMEFVLSRTGILDIFLMTFVLAAFGAMLIDRDMSRSRLAQAVVLRPGDEAGPELGIRKWRVLAGLLIGLACAVKQDAVLVHPRVRRPVGRVGHKRATSRRTAGIPARRDRP